MTTTKGTTTMRRYEVFYIHDHDALNLDPADRARPAFTNLRDAIKCADYWNNHDGCDPDDPDYMVVNATTGRIVYPD
jgi:hypothetical protein